ncbi:MAG TPA: hypothetical protein VFQ65_23405 [Kofleriaceae bacterium]|nr:hypothetical protein [Kofleriaceae bacterium]
MKLTRILIILLGLGIPALAIAHATASDSCCQPGASCCHDPSCPFCPHAK